MKAKTETTFVIFRKWKDTGTIIALFPTIPSDRYGWQCLSYEHVGQHGGADLQGVKETTTPAGAQETIPLRRELRRRGYRLEPIRRTTARMHEQRRAEARRYRACTA